MIGTWLPGAEKSNYRRASSLWRGPVDQGDLAALAAGMQAAAMIREMLPAPRGSEQLTISTEIMISAKRGGA